MIGDTSDRLIPFSCDLHIHSALSPCAEENMNPEQVIKKILTLDIDIFSITDHNSCFNCTAFEKFAKENNILFIPGIELQTSEEIHLLGYFPDIISLNNFYSNIVKPGMISNIKNDPDRFGHQIKINEFGRSVGEEETMLSMALNLSIDTLVDGIHSYNGIAVAAHLDRGFSVISQLGFIPPQLKLDAVEIWNVSKIGEIKNNYLLDRNLNIISSSDSHYIDMMKKSKMKLVIEKADVNSCLNCIKGVGPGRITIIQKDKKKFQKNNKSAIRSNVDRSSKDWKSLYK